MPISGPGISTTERGRARGFTILEILVVVAIIAIILSTILLTTRISRPETALQQHARNIGKTLRLLYDEAQLEDANYALWLQPGRFQVIQYDGESWLPLKDRLFKRLAREHPYQDELTVSGQPVPIEVSDKPQPHILILASGETTPFDWRIVDRRNRIWARLQGDGLGKVVTEGPSPLDPEEVLP